MAVGGRSWEGNKQHQSPFVKLFRGGAASAWDETKDLESDHLVKQKGIDCGEDKTMNESHLLPISPDLTKIFCWGGGGFNTNSSPNTELENKKLQGLSQCLQKSQMQTQSDS